MRRFISFVFSLVYLIVGVVVAASHHYFEHLDAVKPIASAALAVWLWPPGAVRGQPSSQVTVMRTNARDDVLDYGAGRGATPVPGRKYRFGTNQTRGLRAVVG
jgi:hypothetical protein